MASRHRLVVLAFALAGAVAAACSAFDSADDGPPVAPPFEGGGDGGGLDATADRDPSIVDAAVDTTDGNDGPVVIASGMGNPLAIANSDQRIAWATTAGLFWCSKPDCSNAVPLPTSGGLNDLAGAPSDFFVVAGGGLSGHVARIDSSGTYTKIGGTLSPYPYAVAVNPTLVVALNSSSGTPDAGGAFKMAYDGGAFAQVASQTAGGTTHNWARLTTTPSRVFVGDYGYIYSCTLPACPGGWTLFAGGATTALQIQLVTGLAASDTDLFWTSRDKPGLYRCALNAGPCGSGTLIASSSAFGGERPNLLVFQGGSLHITTPKGALYRCTVPACNDITPVAVGDAPVFGRPSVDDTAYYWLTRDVDAGTDAGSAPVPYRVLKLMR